MSAPAYVRRIARLPAVLGLLAGFPDGLPLRTLAAQVDTTPEKLREDLTTYLDGESAGWDLDIFRRPVVEFGTGDGGDTIVRVVGEGAGLGVEHVGAGDLALVYTAGLALLDVEPDDEALASALRVLAETTLGDDAAQPAPEPVTGHLASLRRALEERRRVRIVYSRSWHAGVTDRVVEPLRLLQTRRGWELDAGPAVASTDDAGREGLRTFLLSHVRDAEVLDETFEPPARRTELLEAQRRTTTVRVELAHTARWAADMYAEQVRVVTQDEETVVADLDLLAPVERRLGLLMLAGGPRTRVLTAGRDVLPAAVDSVAELLAHHEGRAED